MQDAEINKWSRNSDVIEKYSNLNNKKEPIVIQQNTLNLGPRNNKILQRFLDEIITKLLQLAARGDPVPEVPGLVAAGSPVNAEAQ